MPRFTVREHEIVFNDGGMNLLSSDALVEVTVGNNKIVPEKVEAGTGFYEHKFLRTEVQPSMSAISCCASPTAGPSTAAT